MPPFMTEGQVDVNCTYVSRVLDEQTCPELRDIFAKQGMGKWRHSSEMHLHV